MFKVSVIPKWLIPVDAALPADVKRKHRYIIFSEGFSNSSIIHIFIGYASAIQTPCISSEILHCKEQNGEINDNPHFFFQIKETKLSLVPELNSPCIWFYTVLCKSNERVIRRNSRISALFDEKCRRFIHLESSKKIQRIFPLPIFLFHANFRAASRVYR